MSWWQNFLLYYEMYNTSATHNIKRFVDISDALVIGKVV